MKNILKKLNIHESTYILLLISLLCGYFKPIIFLILIIIIHELGHVLTTIILGYRIKRVTIYPFGGLTIIDKPLNASIKKDFLIAISGILMQLLLYLFIKNELIKGYNTTIILFNLLPLIPLDGSHILFDIISSFFSYYKTIYIYHLISLICLIAFLIYQLLIGKQLLITIILLIEWYISFRRKKLSLERFYLERYLNDYPYQKIENNYHLDYHLLKINTRHFFYYHNHFINEHELLKKHYEIV